MINNQFKIGLRNIIALCAITILSVSGPSARARISDAPELLEKGIYEEETKGDTEAAILDYQQILADTSADRGIVAQAELRLGLCQLKLGEKEKASATLERLTRDFPDKSKLLALVQPQMPVLLDEILKLIERNYVREVDRNDLVDTALHAILGKLDKQSDFLGEREITQVNQQLKQKIAGIGARLSFDKTNRTVIVDGPLPGSPAAKAGLRPGDTIAEIDGVLPASFTEGKELETAVNLIKGTPGTTVELGIKHLGSASIESIRVVRDTVRLASVFGNGLKPDQTPDFILNSARNIGYIRLSDIGNQSPNEMEDALKELVGRGMKGLVLDLRNNPGGLLSEAVAISDLFVEEGVIVTVKGRSGDAQVFSAKKEGTYSGFPVALLVNRNTASAAEIIAAALQDHHRATVIGERTVGQGLVKTLISLEGGKSALKIPTSTYYRPSGMSMNRYPDSKDSDDWGVQPDPGYEVTLSDEELKEVQTSILNRQTPGNSVNSQNVPDDRQLRAALESLLGPG